MAGKVGTQRRAKRNARWRTTVLCLAFIEVAAFVLGTKAMAFVINTTDSLARGFYVRDISGDEPLHRGDLVSFCPPPVAIAYAKKYFESRSMGLFCRDSGGEAYVKIVAAVPGDRVALTSAGVSVNGGPLIAGTCPLTIVPGNHHPHRLPYLARTTYRIRFNEVWAYTPQWYSFDSRYFGPVVWLHRMKPLLVGHLELQTTMPARIARLQTGR